MAVDLRWASFKESEILSHRAHVPPWWPVVSSAVPYPACSAFWSSYHPRQQASVANIKVRVAKSKQGQLFELGIFY